MLIICSEFQDTAQDTKDPNRMSAFVCAHKTPLHKKHTSWHATPEKLNLVLSHQDKKKS